MTLDAASGARYRLEHRGDLAPTNWTLLAPVTLEDNQFYYVDEPVANHWRRFYRAGPAAGCFSRLAVRARAGI